MHCRWSRIQRLSRRLGSSLGAGYCSWHRSYLARRLGNSNIFVCTAVVKEPAIFVWNHTLHKHDVRDLADFLPLPFRGEDGRVGAREEFAGIVAVEDSNSGAVDEMIVGTVVNQHDALLGEDWWGAGLDDAGVKHSGATRKDGSLCGFGPVKEIGGVGEAHLVGLIGGSAEPVHPIFAVDLLGNNGAGFCPAFVPISFVGGKDDAFALPVDEIE